MLSPKQLAGTGTNTYHKSPKICIQLKQSTEIFAAFRSISLDFRTRPWEKDAKSNNFLKLNDRARLIKSTLQLMSFLAIMP